MNLESITFCVKNLNKFYIALNYLYKARKECAKQTPYEIINPNFVADLNGVSNITTVFQIVRIISILSNRLPTKFSCLHKSIALSRILRRFNISHSLKIGFHAKNASLDPGHAWVCVGNKVFSWGVTIDEFSELRPYT